MNWKEVRPYLEMPHFRKEVIERKNMAAAGLCAWVVNIVIYHDILVRAPPLYPCVLSPTPVLVSRLHKLSFTVSMSMMASLSMMVWCRRMLAPSERPLLRPT